MPPPSLQSEGTIASSAPPGSPPLTCIVKISRLMFQD